MSLSDLKPRSDSAVVRNRLDEIEKALRSGASRKSVYLELKSEHDLKLSFSGFVKALARARKKVRPGQDHQSRDSNQELSKPESQSTDYENQAKPDLEAKQKRTKKRPLKPGSFKPPEDFDPSEFDKRFK